MIVNILLMLHVTRLAQTIASVWWAFWAWCTSAHAFRGMPPLFLPGTPDRLPVPQPDCPALAAMRQPPQWQTVFSVPNLDSFTNFVAYYATDEEIEELLQLPVVYHTGVWDAIAFRVPIGVMVKNRWVALPEAECQLSGCSRCEIGRSGYSFYWMDERWTPEAAIDMTQTLEEMRAESQQPWPRGILRPPQPSREPATLLTTEWDLPTDLWER